MDELTNHFKTELMPSENEEHLKRFYKLKGHKYLVKPQFAMAVVGSAGCGKTSVIYTMMSKLYKGYFDMILIYSGTKDSQKAWESLGGKKNKNPTVIVKNEFEKQEFEELYNQSQEINNKRRDEKKLPLNILIVFDDMAGRSLLSPHKQDILLHMLLNRRHCNISIIFSSQRYRLLPQDWRTTNINAVIVCGINTVDLKNLAEEHTTSNASPEMIEQMYYHTKKKDKYLPFIIDLTQPIEKRFKMGWLKFFKAKNSLIQDNEDEVSKES